MGPVLPFTAEVLDSLTGRYVAAIWPLPVVAPLLALAAFGLAVRPVRGGGRIVAALLAAAWAGVGIDFHLHTLSTIDFMATVYGAFFLVQAVLFAWTGVVRGAFAPGFRTDTAAWTGVALTAFAIAGYPLLALAIGRSWPSLPIVGVTPDPTAMFTLGLLLMLRPVRLHLFAVPVLWSLVAGMMALSLDTPYRLVLPVIAVAAVAITLRRRATA